MDKEEQRWWVQNKLIVESLKPYDYLKLLEEGKVKFKWKIARFEFLKRWWWQKYGQDWQKKDKPVFTEPML